jgi:hypothetical protein
MEVVHGCVGGWDSVGMLIDEHLVVGAIDRVVQDGAVQPQLHAADHADWAIQDEGISDLRGHRVTDPFLLASLCNMRAVGIAECDADANTLLGFADQEIHHLAVLGKKQSAVDEQIDAVFCGCEQVPPAIA